MARRGSLMQALQMVGVGARQVGQAARHRAGSIVPAPLAMAGVLGPDSDHPPIDEELVDELTIPTAFTASELRRMWHMCAPMLLPLLPPLALLFLPPPPPPPLSLRLQQQPRRHTPRLQVLRPRRQQQGHVVSRRADAVGVPAAQRTR